MSYRSFVKRPPVQVKKDDADIIWRYDMRKELGVAPHAHTHAAGSLLVAGDILYCSTFNGQTYDHVEVPVPKAPTLIALNRKIAERPDATPDTILVGEEDSGLSKRILHGTWSSPSFGAVCDRGTVFFGGPDGFCYAFDTRAVKDADGFSLLPEIWRYDCNPPHYRFEDGDTSKPVKYSVQGKGPSEIIAAPVYHRGRVYVAIGQDPEHGEGVGNFSCIDATTGRKIWDYRIHRSMSTCSIVNGLVYIADYSGYVHCLRAADGTLMWRYDTQTELWGSTLVADDKVYVGNGDGVLTVISARMMRKLVADLGAPLDIAIKKRKLVVTLPDKRTTVFARDRIGEFVQKIEFDDRIDSSPVAAQGVLYITTQRHLYAIKDRGE